MRRLPFVLAVALLALAGSALVPGARGVGPTHVQGEVFGLWTAEGSPYIVTGNAFVPAGTTLDVGPGVEVRFALGTSLAVRGGLVVRGSDLGPVAFTSNASAFPGSWGGVVVEGTASITSASITYASSGLDVAGGSAVAERLSVLHSKVGLKANGSSVSVARSTFSFNEFAGIDVMSSRVDLTGVELASNGWGLVLVGATASMENGTISGSILGDADLRRSQLTLLNTTRKGGFQFHDLESTVRDRWFAHVLVKDVYGSPVGGASVTVEGGGLPQPILRTTEPDGRTRWIDLTGQVTSLSGTSAPMYGFAATAPGNTGTSSATLSGETTVSISLPADVTAPVASAGPDLSAPEDTAVTFDGRGSADNDPAFPAGASFAWRFDDGASPVLLTGAVATHTFATPGTYPVVLEVGDASGNAAVDLLVVRVLDRTAPVAGMALPAQAYEGDSVVLDGRASQDNDPAFADTGNFTWTVEAGGTRRNLYGRTVTFSEWWGPADYSVTLRVRDAGGNEDVATGTIQILPRPGFEFAWLAAALAAWFGTLGIAGTERGRMAFITWFVLPLYTRMKKDEVLDQFTRGQIYGYVVVHPGDSYVDIKRNLQLNNGTLTHHLNVLERDGRIVSKNVGTRKLFYAKGARIPEDGGGMHEVQQQILKHLRESGGLAVSDVAGVIAISRQLAIYHLRDLSRRGLVRIERRAFRIVAFADEPRAPPSSP